MTRLWQLDRQIARLGRRADQLNVISGKYWTARRIIFFAGALLALAFCNFTGTTSAWIVAALLGWIVLSQRLNGWQIVGAVIVLISVVLGQPIPARLLRRQPAVVGSRK